MQKQVLKAGWGEEDITPEEKTLLKGQFYRRISTHINDPLSATVLALQDSKGELLLWISFDLLNMAREDRDLLVDALTKEIPGFKPENLICSCIHNHTGPYLNSNIHNGNRGGSPLEKFEIPEGCLKPEDYMMKTLIPKTVKACKEACSNLLPTGFSTVLGHAVIGYNRRMLMRDGTAVMYGNCDDYNFDRPEGPCDHGIEMMFTYGQDRKLKGLIVNINCPAQVLDRKSFISADFIGLFRILLKEKMGYNLPVLTLIGAAGNISPRDYRNFVRGGRERPDMWEMEGAVELSKRLMNCFLYNLDTAAGNIAYEAEFAHIYREIQLPILTVSKSEIDQAKKEYDRLMEKYNGKLQNLPFEDNRALIYARGSLTRAELQQKCTLYNAPVHAVRIGDSAFITNPFELYIEYGIRMRARAKATHTFIAQLTDDNASYLPTAHAIKAKGYSTATGSCLVGSEGGELLTEASISMINSLFA